MAELVRGCIFTPNQSVSFGMHVVLVRRPGYYLSLPQVGRLRQLPAPIRAPLPRGGNSIPELLIRDAQKRNARVMERARHSNY